MARNFYEYARKDARTFYVVRNIARRIRAHEYHVELMTTRDISYGQAGILEAEFRASHKPHDILAEGYEICKQIGYLSTVVRKETGIRILSQRYDIDSVKLRADLKNNEIEAMISEFADVIYEIGISADSVYDAAVNEN